MKFQRLSLEGMDEWAIVEDRIGRTIENSILNALDAKSLEELRYYNGFITALRFVLELPSIIEKEESNAIGQGKQQEGYLS